MQPWLPDHQATTASQISDDGSEDSKSIHQDDSETDEEGGDNYEDEAPKGEGEGEDTDTESWKNPAVTLGSSSQSSHSSLETDGEIQACTGLASKRDPRRHISQGGPEISMPSPMAKCQ